MSVFLTKTAALRELMDLCEPDSEPQLTVPELERILNKFVAFVWEANTVYEAGVHIIPQLGLANGHKYLVVTGGTSGSTGPTSWSTIDQGQVLSGDLVMMENGSAGVVAGYDVDRAAWEAWNKKMAKAAQFMKTPGIDMSSIFDRCEKMRDSFDSVMVA